MLTVGHPLPDFRLPAVKAGPLRAEPFTEVRSEDYRGRWLVLFFWPMDFTFVCPTEIAEFGRKAAEFERRGAAVLGASTDTHPVHLAWRQHHRSLENLSIPMLADHRRELSGALGVLHPVEGVALRATFLVDPKGIIRWVNVNDLDVGRNVDETLRVLDALQTGEQTPVGWLPGQATLAGR